MHDEHVRPGGDADLTVATRLAEELARHDNPFPDVLASVADALGVGAGAANGR